MATASDAVIEGRVVDVAAGRVFGDPSDGGVAYATLSVEVSRLLVGVLPVEHQDKLSLEVVVPDSTQMPSLVASKPDESVVFFLRNKGMEAKRLGFPNAVVEVEASYYRLVIANGFIRIFDGDLAAPPLVEERFIQLLDGQDAQPFLDRLQLLGAS